MKSSVFRAVVSVTPWWLARKVFWKKNNRKDEADEKFNNLSRRNSRIKFNVKKGEDKKESCQANDIC